jgi:hypothetical protein
VCRSVVLCVELPGADRQSPAGQQTSVLVAHTLVLAHQSLDIANDLGQFVGDHPFVVEGLAQQKLVDSLHYREVHAVGEQ